MAWALWGPVLRCSSPRGSTFSHRLREDNEGTRVADFGITGSMGWFAIAGAFGFVAVWGLVTAHPGDPERTFFAWLCAVALATALFGLYRLASFAEIVWTTGGSVRWRRRRGLLAREWVFAPADVAVSRCLIKHGDNHALRRRFGICLRSDAGVVLLCSVGRAEEAEASLRSLPGSMRDRVEPGAVELRTTVFPRR